MTSNLKEKDSTINKNSNNNNNFSQSPNLYNDSSTLTYLDTINPSLPTSEFDVDIPPEILQQAFKARLDYSQKSQPTAFKPTMNESSKLTLFDYQTSSATNNTLKTPLKYQQTHIKRLHDEMDDWKTWLNKTFEQSSCLQKTELKLNNPTTHLN
ncbi:unnamed protein product [Cunninghamella echinulata]